MRKYALEITENEDKVLSFKSENDGFNAFELLGFLTIKKEDILKQVRGEIKPDTITRNVVKD